MPKITNYPRKSFDTAMSIAEGVEKLGGKCSEQILSDKLGKSGGSFAAGLNSAVKHGLISKEKENLKITELFKNIKLSYTDEERNSNLIKAFLLPDTYREILERFNGKELPIDVLDKMLIKEYQVHDNVSESVANNLIKGAEQLGLINAGKVRLSKEAIKIAHETDQNKPMTGEEEPDVNAITDNVQGQKETVSKRLQDQLGRSAGQKDIVININIQLTVQKRQMKRSTKSSLQL